MRVKKEGAERTRKGGCRNLKGNGHVGKAPKKRRPEARIPQAPSFLFSSSFLSCVELSPGVNPAGNQEDTIQPGAPAGRQQDEEGHRREQEESITGADRLHEAMENSSVTNKNKAANMHCEAVLGVPIGQEHLVKGTESMNHDHPCLPGHWDSRE